YLENENIKVDKRFKESLRNCINERDPEWFISLKTAMNKGLDKLIKEPIPEEHINLWNEIKEDIRKYVENFSIEKVDIYVKIYHLFLKFLEKRMKEEIYVPLEYIKRRLSKLDFSYPVYDYFLIDEFQDTSYTQWKILEPLLKTSKSLFVVGDKKQAIYRWRGGVTNLFE
ncbi:MAG: UvrD-helicase domain-containing protein, partial [Candidatus Altarchaeaceae archaeon]